MLGTHGYSGTISLSAHKLQLNSEEGHEKCLPFDSLPLELGSEHVYQNVVIVSA